ncbi:hypothetical protein [Burkholderia ambifaria]|uniref:hypothetical protein n=1 Tax=Burkholderia ambifaria TaxID=152480 RepID=UPI000F8012DA|nr:hypothetical protein [Burkholderia ambifaria]
MKKIFLSVALMTPVLLALSQYAAAQTQPVPPALPFDGRAHGADASLPPPPPPVGSGASAGVVANGTDASAGNLRVVLVMGPVATVEEVDQTGKALRTTTLKDGGTAIFKGKRFKAQVKDGEVSLAYGGQLQVLGSADSVPVEQEKTGGTTSSESLSAGEGVHELKMDQSVFSNSSGNNSNGNRNNSSNGVSRF